MLGWQVRARGIFTLGDDAAYLLLSRSIRVFSYRELHLVGEPIAARFPPGFPALLALCSTVFGERLDVFTAVGILFSASGIWALFDVVRRRWSVNVALVTAALVAINPALLEYVAIPVSEMVFTSLTLWTLWAADRVETSGLHTTERTRAKGRGTAAIILSILAALTRSAGVTLVLSLIAHWAWRRRWRTTAAMAVAGTVFVGGWLAWTSLAPKREVRMSYIDDAVRPVGNAPPPLTSILVKRLVYNVPTYVTQVSLTVVPVPLTRRTVLDNVGWVLLLGTCFLVGWFAAWKRWQAAAIYIATYCGLLAVWPYLLDRFLVPAIPLALTFIVIGASTITRRLGRWHDVAVAALGALLAIFALRADAAMVDKASSCDRSRVYCAPPTSLDYIDAARFAGSATPVNARFIAPKGPTMYFHGSRQTAFWEEAVRQDSASFLPYLRRNGITHILSSPVYGDYETMLSLVQSTCMRFALVRSFSPHTLILAFRDSATTMTDGERACVFVRRALATARLVAAVSGAATSDDRTALGRAPERLGRRTAARETERAGPGQVRYVHTKAAEANVRQRQALVGPRSTPSTRRSSSIRHGESRARTTRGVASTKHRYSPVP